MKRFLCILFAVLLCSAFTSCTFANQASADTVTFYYCTDPEDYEKTLNAFSAETRQADVHSPDIHSLLQLYLDGPLSPSLVSPFPEDVVLENITIDGANAQLTLSSSFNTVMDMDLTLACACLTMTLQDLIGAERVTIRAVNHYGAVQTVVTMSKESLLLIDTAEAQKGN